MYCTAADSRCAHQSPLHRITLTETTAKTCKNQKALQTGSLKGLEPRAREDRPGHTSALTDHNRQRSLQCSISIRSMAMVDNMAVLSKMAMLYKNTHAYSTVT